MRCLVLNLIDNFSDESEFLEERNSVFVLVEEHAGNVSVLNDEDVLVDERLQGIQSDLLEKRNELSELTDLRELMLEVLPNLVRLHAFRLLASQQDLVSDLFIKIFVELSQLLALDVALGDVFVLGVHLEEPLPVAEVDSLVIGQFQVLFE